MAANSSMTPQANWRILAELTLPAVELAELEVASAVHELCLPPVRLAQLQMAVAEAMFNAGGPETPWHSSRLRVLLAAGAELVDQGCAARGWGFFIIEASYPPGQAKAVHGLDLFLYRDGMAVVD